MSSASLAHPHSVTTHSSLRQKLSIPKIRTRAVSDSNTSPSSPRSVMCSPLSKGPSSPQSDWSMPTDAASMFPNRSSSPPVHPYDNPELPGTRTRDSIYPKSFVSFDTKSEESFSRRTSAATLTPSLAASNSLATPPHQIASSKAESRARDRDRDREISRPIPLPSQNFDPDPKLRENAASILGWETPVAFPLISLEEARAQRLLKQLNPSTGSSPVVPQPDSDSDVAPSLYDNGGDGDRSSATSIASESDIVVHNIVPVRPCLGHLVPLYPPRLTLRRTGKTTLMQSQISFSRQAGNESITLPRRL